MRSLKRRIVVFDPGQRDVNTVKAQLDKEAAAVPKLEKAIAVSEPFKAKRGRPTAHQSAAIERVIHEAAAKAFLSIGYERTSMEAVAAEAGVPKSTLYKRFPDKRTLLRAVLSA